MFLAACLMCFSISSAAWAAFSDVPESHWAAGTIDKMSELGVVGGYTDGTFKPGKTVNQAEAVCMAVRAMNLQSDANTAQTQLTFTVPEGMESDIRLALQHGLVKSDEFSVNSGASRAWVARLLVRVIGKESEAEEKLLLPNYTDAYKIPDWAVYYVRVAQDYDLIAGYDDHSFRPDNNVSRAEMVSFLARAMNMMPNTVTTPDPVTTPNPITTPAPSQSTGNLIGGSVVNGTIVKVYPEENALVLLDGWQNINTYYLPDNTSISVIGSNSSGLGVLQPGDNVQVTLDTAGYVSKINVLSRGTAAGNEGVVYDLDFDTGLLTLQMSNNQLKPYLIDDNVSVRVDGVRFPTLQDIRDGDRVKVTIDGDRVTEIELLKEAASLNVSGEVVIIDTSKNIINLNVHGSLQIYRLSSNVDVNISGISAGAFLSDIKEGDTVTAEIEDGYVVALNVTGREAQDELRGTVMAVDSTNDIITLKDRLNNIKVYDILANARIIVNSDDDADISDIKQDMEVKFRLLDGDIIYINTDNASEGIITNLDKDGMIMDFQHINGDKKTYFIQKNVDINSKDKRSDLEDIRRGDYAKIMLDDDEVDEINLQSKYIYQVENVRKSYSRLEAVDLNGNSERLYVENGVDLVVPGITYPNLNDVNEGDLVQATYYGTDLDQVEVLSPARGIITAVDPTGSIFSINLFNGGTRTISFRSGDRIEIGTKVYGNISYLKVGDRVEVLENASSGTVIRTAEEVAGTLAEDCSSGDSHIYIDKGYNWKRYDLNNHLYIHTNSGSTYSLGNLRKGMDIKAYMFWDEIYELVVQ